MQFKLGSGRLTMANLLAALVFAKISCVLAYHWLSGTLDVSPNWSTLIARSGELLIFLGLVASIYAPRRIPFYVFFGSSRTCASANIFRILVTVCALAALSRYVIEILMIGLASVFDPKSIDDARSGSHLGAPGWALLADALSAGKVMATLSIGPVVEEIIYRGVLLNYLLLHYRTITALTISSLIFAVFHGNPIAPFFGGLVFGLIYLRTGSLIYCVIAHSVANAMVVVLYLDPSVVFPLLRHDVTAAEFGIWFFCGLSILLLGLCTTARRYFKESVDSVFKDRVIVD